MKSLLIFALGILVGMWAARKRREGNAPGGTPPLIKQQGEEKDANKSKLLEAFSARGRMANDEAMKILGVSEATATRYLDELEHDGRIRQVGKTGRSVYYEKVQ